MSASHKAVAFWRMASNTGCVSVGELLNYPENLGRRRLPLERLPRLGEEPHVLDRDHRLVGEGPEERELLIAERPDSFRSIAIAPSAVSPRSKGAATMVRWP